MLDLFSGLGGASAAMVDRGWHVVRIDFDPRYHPDVLSGVRKYHWDGPKPDLVWASPPCTEFARESMPWCARGVRPDLALIFSTLRIVSETDPFFWLMENVRGSVRWLRPFLGDPIVAGSLRLWGNPPPGLALPVVRTRKEHLSSKRRAERARIPYRVSLAIAHAVERTMQGLSQ